VRVAVVAQKTSTDVFMQQTDMSTDVFMQICISIVSKTVVNGETLIACS
jgi:hypothetical protein